MNPPESTQAKWDRRFRTQSELPEPAAVLTDNVRLLPGQGRALDIACGLGANSLFLARRGLRVDAWDLSAVALAKLTRLAGDHGLAIRTQQIDVEAHFDATSNYDLIIVSRFLYRPLCDKLIDALKPGGLLFYQTFTRHDPRQVSASGNSSNGQSPRNLAYKLTSNELLRLFGALELVYYREDGLVDPAAQDDRDESEQGLLRNQACYIGRKPR